MSTPLWPFLENGRVCRISHTYYEWGHPRVTNCVQWLFPPQVLCLHHCLDNGAAHLASDYSPHSQEALYKDPKYLGEHAQYPQASSVQGQKGRRTDTGSVYSTFPGKGTCSWRALKAMGQETSFYLFYIFFSGYGACGILVPQPGIELALSAVEAWSLNHWAAREVPRRPHFKTATQN